MSGRDVEKAIGCDNLEFRARRSAQELPVMGPCLSLEIGWGRLGKERG